MSLATVQQPRVCSTFTLNDEWSILKSLRSSFDGAKLVSMVYEKIDQDYAFSVYLIDANCPDSKGIRLMNSSRASYIKTAISRDGKMVAVGDFKHETISIFDGNSGQLIRTIYEKPQQMAMSDDGERFVVGASSALHVLDITGTKIGSIVHPVPHKGFVGDVVFGKQYLVADGGRNIYVYKTDTMQLAWETALDSRYLGLSDDYVVIVAEKDAVLHVLNIHSGDQVHSVPLKGHTRDVESVSISNDRLLVGIRADEADDEDVFVYKRSDGIWELEEFFHSESPFQKGAVVAMAPNGETGFISFNDAQNEVQRICFGGAEVPQCHASQGSSATGPIYVDETGMAWEAVGAIAVILLVFLGMFFRKPPLQATKQTRYAMVGLDTEIELQFSEEDDGNYYLAAADEGESRPYLA